MNRQGNSLPWSGARAAIRRRSASWSLSGPGARSVTAEQERRSANSCRVSGEDRIGQGWPKGIGAGKEEDMGGFGSRSALEIVISYDF
jgi:hypothetical protein